MTRGYRTLSPLLRPLSAGLLSIALFTACNAERGGAADVQKSAGQDAGTSRVPWHTVFGEMDSMLLAGWAPSDEEAFFVGGEGQVLHYSNSTWSRFEVPTQATLWWVWGSSNRDVYVGGEAGTLLHFDGTRWQRLDVGLDAAQTIWGIWGSDADDVWLVGGRAMQNGPGFVLRGAGSHFDEVHLDTALPNLFKVWGRSAEEVYLVGDRGTVIEVGPASVQRQQLDPEGDGERLEALFTVAGNAQGDLLAVGGVTSGMLFDKRGSSWQFDDVQAPGLNGVALAESGEAYAVGQRGSIRHRIDGSWQSEDYAPERHYHGVVLMGDVVFAMGGDLLSAVGERRGLLAARGPVSAGEIAWIRGSSPKHADASDPQVPDPREPADAAVPRPMQPRHHDAGVRLPPHDAGSHDSGVAPSELPGAAQQCNVSLQCADELECWFIQGEQQSRCVTPCSTADECPAEYGDNPQCAVPGCQTLHTVCMPAGWKGCF